MNAYRVNCIDKTEVNTRWTRLICIDMLMWFTITLKPLNSLFAFCFHSFVEQFHPIVFRQCTIRPRTRARTICDSRKFVVYTRFKHHVASILCGLQMQSNTAIDVIIDDKCFIYVFGCCASNWVYASERTPNVNL